MILVTISDYKIFPVAEIPEFYSEHINLHLVGIRCEGLGQGYDRCHHWFIVVFARERQVLPIFVVLKYLNDNFRYKISLFSKCK